MDQYSSSFSSLLSLIITLFFLAILQPSPSSAADHFSKIYAFGDSYTDTGNTLSSTGPTDGIKFPRILQIGNAELKHIPDSIEAFDGRRCEGDRSSASA